MSIAPRLFKQALHIAEPWFVNQVEFSTEKKRLDIHIDFKRGSMFYYESQDEGIAGNYKVYDTVDKTWRHLNFFEHECHLHCRTPRIKTDDNKVRLIKPPWAGINSGFTLLFEALIVELASNMPIHKVSLLIHESDYKIWDLLEKYVEESLSKADHSNVNKVGIDETSKSKNHNYITLFVDLDEKRTIFITEGKEHETVEEFAIDFEAHQGRPENISNISCDMSPAFIKGVKENLPNAEITFDKFHILKILNEAVDKVRKMEAKGNPLLKNTKFIFLKNRNNLTDKQIQVLENLSLAKLNLKTMRALQIRENFQSIYNAGSKDEFIILLRKWYFWATHSRLQPMIKAAKTIKKHWGRE